MPMRTTQWKWMALGGLLCLVGGVVVSRLGDNPLTASPEPTPPQALPLPSVPAETPKLPELPPVTPSSATAPTTTLPLPLQEPPPPPTPLPAIQTTPTFPAPGGLQPVGLTEPVPASPTPPPLPQATAPLTQPLPQATLPSSATQPTVPPVQQIPASEPNLPPATPPQQPQAPRTFVQPNTLPPATVTEPGEPPLTATGPTQVYRVRHAGETVREIARKTLNTTERTHEILRLNPGMPGDKVFAVGDTVTLPADACLPTEDVEAVRPLPAMRRETAPKVAVVLPLTGTFPCNLDEKRVVTLPRAIRDQLGNCPTVLVSPGPDQCLWLTNQAHLGRLAERLEKSTAREVDVRVFKRLYFAQTERLPVSPDGRITLSEKLAQFADLHQEIVLVGIDDHFELWDVARWRQYTQEKSSGRGGNDSD